MNHTYSEVKVYVTTAYNSFAKIKGNRILNNPKIKKMVRDILHGIDFLSDFPILVNVINGKLDVVDGQHRLEAAKQTKKPIYYIIRKDQVSLQKIARMNSLQDKWKFSDFISCYIENGNSHYKKLLEFQDSYSFPLSTALNLLYFGITGKDTGADEDLATLFKSGEFQVKHFKQARDIAEACQLFCQFRGWNSRCFIIAISKILTSSVCDFDELVKKFTADPSQLIRRGTVKEYLTLLEQVYNKGYSKRRVIYQ